MVVEFDPQCGTAQPEDTLQLFVPACRRPDATPPPSVNLNEDGEPVSKVAYWPILRKFHGTNNWPKASVVIPGKLVSTEFAIYTDFKGPVIQSIGSLTSSLRGQLVKCFKIL